MTGRPNSNLSKRNLLLQLQLDKFIRQFLFRERYSICYLGVSNQATVSRSWEKHWKRYEKYKNVIEIPWYFAKGHISGQATCQYLEVAEAGMRLLKVSQYAWTLWSMPESSHGFLIHKLRCSKDKQVTIPKALAGFIVCSRRDFKQFLTIKGSSVCKRWGWTPVNEVNLQLNILNGHYAKWPQSFQFHIQCLGEKAKPLWFWCNSHIR